MFLFLTLTMPNFLNETIHLKFFGTVHYHFRDIKMKSQQYRAWSHCMKVKAGLALYLWQRLITFGVGRIQDCHCMYIKMIRKMIHHEGTVDMITMPRASQVNIIYMFRSFIFTTRPLLVTTFVLAFTQVKRGCDILRNTSVAT